MEKNGATATEPHQETQTRHIKLAISGKNQHRNIMTRIIIHQQEEGHQIKGNITMQNIQETQIDQMRLSIHHQKAKTYIPRRDPPQQHQIDSAHHLMMSAKQTTMETS